MPVINARLLFFGGKLPIQSLC